MAANAQQIVDSVKADIEKARAESVKAKVKKLMEERLQAEDVIKGIDAKIAEELARLG